jgi:RNA recognition motif-containing protein
MKTLYVGNLPWNITDAQLAEFFATCAPVSSARIITEGPEGRSKGFGFVEVADEDAEKVIKNLSGQSLNGRDITISEARPKPKKS